MRKLSIVLLVGLMLIGGMSVGIYAQQPPEASSDSAATNESGESAGTTASASAVTYASATVKTIAAIYVHKTVNLGELTSSDYTIGSGYTADVLKDTGNTIKAFANKKYEVTVSASQASSTNNDRNFDMDRLKINGGSEDLNWTAFSSSTIKPIDTTSGGLTNTTVGYKYVPDSSDKPGNYKAELTYTVTTG